MKYFAGTFLVGVLPRLLQIGFVFAQPFLVDTTVSWVDAPTTANTKSQGYGLVGAFAITYTGIAVRYSPWKGAFGFSPLIPLDINGTCPASSLPLGLDDASQLGRHDLPAHDDHA